MPAPAFRLRSTVSHVRTACGARKPRHPLLRLALGLLGLGVVLTLVFFSVFIGIAMLSIGVLARSWRWRRQPLARARRSVDGACRLLDQPALAKPALPHA